ncbi:MAG: hypothetical protein QXT22_04045 [Candidatus Hadarchaeales archaeon]
MEEGGISSIFDLLLLATVVSVLMVLLVSFAPTAKMIDQGSYAAAYSRGITASLLGSRARDFQYSPEVGGLLLPTLPTRKLKFTTLADLIAEGFSLSFKGDFDRELEKHLREFFDNTLGRRFAYRFYAGTESKEVVVENLSNSRAILWVKETTLLAPFPKEGGEILWLPVRMKLEVWSK